MERQTLLLGPTRPPLALGVAGSIAAVAAITALIYPLREVAPAVSTGVVYLLAVLAISTVWGLRLGLLTSVLSAAAFNFFHIPPTGEFTIGDPQNIVGLAVFLAAALLASSVAGLARTRAVEAETRRREAVLAAELARVLLGGGRLADSLDDAATRVAEALELDWSRLRLGSGPPDVPEGVAIGLRRGDAELGMLVVPEGADAEVIERVRERVAPALETLLAAGLERERLRAEAVEADALRRSDEIKTALLRAVSHDLRTPLTAIVASGDALASPNLSPEERTALADALSDEASRLTRMVDQLLDLSRLEAGAADPRRDWCSIEEIAQVAIAQVDPRRFKLSVDRDVPLLNADPAQIERALVNVLENAARHSTDTVSVRARAVGDRLVMRVVDRGSGIRESELERVFEPFYRAGDDAGGGRGSGLGLAIVKGLAEANGGRVWAESLPGQGTVIVFQFPLDPQHRSAGASPATAAAQ